MASRVRLHNAVLMQDHLRAWTAALAVLVLTLVAVGSDLFDRSVRDYWSRHAFTSSVVSGVLVLLLTVLFVDQVNRLRRIKNQSRAVGAQAAVILAQAGRAADAIKRSVKSDEDRDEASQELRTYMQMLLTSTPVLIDASTSRNFLEVAQHTAGQFYREIRVTADDGHADVHKKVDSAVQELRQAAAPLLKPLNREQRSVVASDDVPAGQ
jgi:hypothetical protein